MAFVQILRDVVSFLVVLTVLVFVHEMGHYLIARLNRVRVEVFSIGFGREIYGFTDRSGTRWKIGFLPLGGYVKFFGDASAASTTSGARLGSMSAAERAVSFHHKRLGQRTAIVLAGPAANFLFAIVLFAGLFMFGGQPTTPPVIGEVQAGGAAAVAGFEPGDRVVEIDGTDIDTFQGLRDIVARNANRSLEIVVERVGAAIVLNAVPRPIEIEIAGRTQRVGQLGIEPMIPPIVGEIAEGSAAAEAGFEPGDRIVEIDGTAITYFGDIPRIVRVSADRELEIVVERGGARLALTATPRFAEISDRLGTMHRVGQLGIRSADVTEYVRYDLPASIWRATNRTVAIGVMTLQAVGEMIVGSRTAEDLSGPIGIARLSGQFCQDIVGCIQLAALISISLGLINLFPVPMLDGGHLLFYSFEALRGKPLSARLQDLGFRIGFALVIALVIFVTWNDLVHIDF